MIHEDFTSGVERDGDRPSRLILFPFSTFESFCKDEWVGRESEWFKTFNLLHWTMSYVTFEPAMKIALFLPDLPQLAEILRSHLDDGQLVKLQSDAETTGGDELATRLEDCPQASLNLILATGVFGTGASAQAESRLLRSCHRALKTGGHLLATFPLQDQLGNALTPRNIQFLDAATGMGFEQAEISGGDGITHFLDADFWAKLRKQGRPAFDTMLHAFSQISDEPSALWMSRTAFYAGIKR